MRIVELRSGGGPPAAPVVLADGFVAVVGDGARVFDVRGEPAVALALPGVEEPELAASPSGRCAFVDGSHGRLVDLDAGRIVTEIDAGYGTARPCFSMIVEGIPAAAAWLAQR